MMRAAGSLPLEISQYEHSKSRVRDTEEVLKNEDVADLGQHQKTLTICDELQGESLSDSLEERFEKRIERSLLTVANHAVESDLEH